MSIFTRNKPDGVPTNRQAEQRRDSILESINNLSMDLAEVKADLASTSKVRGTERKLKEAQEALSLLEIQKSQIEEAFARERREIEHHVGLERERTDLEIAQASQQAKLDVREENLQAEKDRFEDHMKFYKEQMDKHIGDVKLLLTQVMSRVPTVTVDRKIRENYTGELTDGAEET